MTSHRNILLVMVAVFCLAGANGYCGNGSVDFNRDIRPILSENCFYCHGQDPNHRKADLRLDQRETAIKLKAIVPGKPDDSELIRRILTTDSDDLMPPPNSHRTLSAAQKETLRRWVTEGAEYKPHWAFIPPQRPAVPAVRQSRWARNPIDHFVLAKLEERKLRPSPEANKTTLVRRLYFDLLGLPPTPEQTEAFLQDRSPNAYEKLVDQLMANPRYGEKMSLPWLDAARYADSNGFQQDGDTFQWVWRDWVVRALNADMPFNQFSIEQLAGDLLPNATADQKVASGFNRNHLLNGEGGAIPEEQRFNILFDRVDTTATTWLGLTVACAQCHDHKFDPVTQKDYYRFMAAFNQLPENGLAGFLSAKIRVAPPFLEIMTDENRKAIAAMEAEINEAEKKVNRGARLEAEYKKWKETVTPETGGLPGPVVALLKKELATRPNKIAPTPEGQTPPVAPAFTDAETKELETGLRKHFEAKVWPPIIGADPLAKEADALAAKLKLYKTDEVIKVMVMEDSRKRDTFILDRGVYEKPKDKVTFGTPEFLLPMDAAAPQNRLGLAQWLFSPQHPLTARVQVNRMWQLFFGTGLVKTSEDLGVQSEMPLHQDLLDWLATEFMQNGWSQKKIHRLILTSATYRQSSRLTPALLQNDPENRLMARASRFRLPSFVLRDLALATSGLIVSEIGGKPVYPYQPEGIWDALAITKERDFTYPFSSGKDLYRRSLYTFWRRTVGPANMFDTSNRQTCRVRLTNTSTPLHALTMLNDITWVEASRVLAGQALQTSARREEQINFAFRKIMGRSAAADELRTLERLFQTEQQRFDQQSAEAEALLKVGAAPQSLAGKPAEQAAMTSVCLALYNLDEAVTRE